MKQKKELTRESLVAGLRAMADWYELNDAPLPYDPHTAIYSIQTKAEIAALARQMGECDKVISNEMFSVVKSFGPVEIRGVVYRNQVCERVVVGYETVTIPAQPAKPEEKVAREIVEWKCGSLMSPVEMSETKLIESPSVPMIGEECPF